MDIEKMTFGEMQKTIEAAERIAKALNRPTSSIAPTSDDLICDVGKSYFIRSVTHHYTGRCVRVNKDWIELEDAAWIADDGRFNNFLKTGEANEVEPYVENVRILIACILDVTEFKHALPKTVK